MSNSHDALYPLAERQGGHFTTSQAHEVGVSDQQLHYLSKSGSIQRVAHGIYRLTRFPAQRFEDVIVAALWAGEGAVASHDTALVIYGLTDAVPPMIHVTVPRLFRGRRRGVSVHTAPLAEGEHTRRQAVPVTSLGRTIRDVTARYGVREAVDVARRALDAGLITRRRLSRELEDNDETRAVLNLLSSAL